MSGDTRKCPRCGIGVDNDMDGDCSVCASASNRLMAEFNRLREERPNGSRAVKTLRDLLLRARDPAHHVAAANARA